MAVIVHRIADVTDLIEASTRAERCKEEVADLNVRVLDRTAALFRANEELLKTNELLRISMQETLVASRAQSDFLANISHELRTPMNAVIGFAQLLEANNVLTGDSRDYVKAIAVSGRHLLGLINDVLDITKLGAGKVILNLQPINIAELLLELAAIFSYRCDEKGVNLETSLPSSLPRTILADSVRLRQMVINLLNNAIKFTDKGKIILGAKVETENVDTQRITVLIFVRDTGTGIAPLDIERLFERFEQVNRGSVVGGAGLGLSITRQLATLMGGEVFATSVLGTGSEFSLRLPFTSVKDQQASPVDSSFQLGTVRSEFSDRVLIVVDDIELNRILLKAILSKMGFKQIREASNGLVCLNLVKNEMPSMILMDIFMPTMDGIEAARRLRNDPLMENVKIIAVSASDLDKETLAEIELNFDDSLPKPVNFEHLRRILEKHCGFQFDKDPISTSALKILVVDDQSFMRHLITVLLVKERQLVDVCSGGQEAIAILKRKAFDIVLLDRLMPVMDGFEAAKRILDEIPSPPLIIMMSASISDEDVAISASIGVNYVLEKPINTKELWKIWEEYSIRTSP